MKILKQIHLQTSTDLNALKQVLSEFEQIYQSWIPQKDWLQCQLALAEGFTNAIRHAHRNLPIETPIDIELTLFQEKIEIKIWDSGAPFDLDAGLKTLKQHQDKHSGGGRGIAILYKIADYLSYSRTCDERNCLLIVKKFED